MAKKKITAEDIKKLAEVGVTVVTIIAPVVEEYGPKIAEVLSDISKKVISAAGEGGKAIADGATKALNGAKDAQASKAEEKALRKAREAAVKACSQGIDAKTFLESCEAARSVAASGSGYMPAPGCYAILLMPNSREKDPAKYKEIYVGSSEHLGDAVYEQLTGNGNPDVYADCKYRKPVQVLLYQCDKENLEELKAALLVNFNALSSYNAREIENQ